MMRRVGLILSILLFIAIPTLSNAQTAIPPLVITPIASEVGDQIEVLGTTYQLTEMEFVRYDTDEVYIIKFPAINNPEIPPTPGQQSAFLSTQWVADSNTIVMSSPHPVQISGFPAGAAESRGSSHLFLKSVLAAVDLPGTLNVGYGPSLSIAAAVGPETIVSLSFSYTRTQNAEAELEDLIDVIPLFDIIPMRDERIMQIEQLRTLLNYIEIRLKDAQP